MTEVRKSKYPWPNYFVWDGGKGAGYKHRIIKWTEPVLETKCGLPFVWHGEMMKKEDGHLPWCEACR